MIAEISTIADVKVFMKELVAEGTNAHPDDDFSSYVNIETGVPAFTPGEAELRNKLMEQCFVVCKTEGQDIYSVMQEIFLMETGLDKYIPLPSRV